MKKLAVLSLLMCALGTVHALKTTESTKKISTWQKREALNTSKRQKKSCRIGKEAFDGFFLGAGLLQKGLTCEVGGGGEHIYEFNDPKSLDAYDNVDLEQNLKGIHKDLYGHDINSIENVALDATGDYITQFKARGFLPAKIASGKSAKFGGAVVMGWGFFVDGNAYLGGDFILNFSKNENCHLGLDYLVNKSAFSDVFRDVKLKQGAVVPTWAAKLGMYLSPLDALFYVRFGASLARFDVANERSNIKTQLSPIFGCGVEKCINGFVVRLDCDYRFKMAGDGDFSKPKKVYMSEIGNDIEVIHTVKARLNARGYDARLMVLLYL